MITEKLKPKELFASFDDTTSQLLQLVSSFSEEELNAIPFEDSWTGGQITDHVAKAIVSITHELNGNGKTTEREPDERMPELKAIFLDFTTKYKSPDFILPTQNHYTKETLIANLKKSIDDLKEACNKANLSEAITDLIFGEITKLEILYLAVVHTQRHLHQLQNVLH